MVTFTPCLRPGCGRHVGSKGDPDGLQSCGKYGCNEYARGLEASAAARDPDSIDLEHPETSGIGRAPRDGDMTIRTMCHTSLMRDEDRATPYDEWTAASWTAWLLRRVSVEIVAEMATQIERTAIAIIEQERTAGEADAAAETSTSGTSDSSPSKAKAASAPSSAFGAVGFIGVGRPATRRE